MAAARRIFFFLYHNSVYEINTNITTIKIGDQEVKCLRTL